VVKNSSIANFKTECTVLGVVVTNTESVVDTHSTKQSKKPATAVETRSPWSSTGLKSTTATFAILTVGANGWKKKAWWPAIITGLGLAGTNGITGRIGANSDAKPAIEMTTVARAVGRQNPT
jgi:hypothetical protein